MILTIMMILYIIWTIMAIVLAYKWFREPYYANFRQEMKWGFIFRPQSCWIGVHHSKYCQRTCINFLPCCTIWVGKKPTII